MAGAGHLAGLPGGGGCGPHQLPVQVGFATENDVPARTFDNGGVAARLSGTWHGADLDLYHYTGQETAPDAQLRALVSSRTPFPDVRLHAAARLVQDSQVMNMTGGDAACRRTSGNGVRLETRARSWASGAVS